MGYYADLIKQKQEKQNAKPFYTLQGRELKTRSEVERYISDLEKEEREYFSYLRSYERKLEEAKNEPKPHSIGWADRISKYTDQIKSYKRSIERTDNWKSKAKEWISQNRNSKEEKEKQNSIVKKGTFNKGTYTIDKTTGMFGRTVYIVHAHYEKGPSKDMTFGSDSFETLQDAQKYADRLNSKEEKDNASVQDRFRHKGCMITILKKGENQYTFSIEQNGREEGTNATYPTQDKAESEAKREVESNWNEKEEGYYAKLAEEKADKKNSKSWRIEFLGNSYYIAKPADVDLALGKARQVLYIKERQLDDEIRYAKESFAKFEKELSQIEKEVYQEFGK